MSFTILILNGGEIEVTDFQISCSKTLKNLIKDLGKNKDHKIELAQFDFKPISLIFEFINQYSIAKKDVETDLQKWCFDTIKNNKDFLDNFGNILKMSQFLQITFLNKILNQYIANEIQGCKTVDEVSKKIGWKPENIPIPKDLEWTQKNE